MTAARAVPTCIDADQADGVSLDDRASVKWRQIAGAVADPEIPVLTLDDLGIVRQVYQNADGTVRVILTPTYTGCPATAAIAADVQAALLAQGASRVEVVIVLSPPWTTAWMTPAGREKLRAFGIAPPSEKTGVISLTLAPACPRCRSRRTREISRFGSTPCKALWVCRDCAEPFDAFKDL